MSETIGANGDELTLIIPSSKQENWATSIRDDCFQKISDHDHQGSGTGKKLIGYLSIDTSTALLPNNTAFKARNAADDGDVEMFKLNTSNQIEFLTTINNADFHDVELGTLTGTVTTFLGDASPQALDTNMVNEINNTGGSAFTLADGVNGQIKILVSLVSSGSAVITPTTFANGTTITLDSTQDTITLVYNSTNGWSVLSYWAAVFS